MNKPGLLTALLILYTLHAFCSPSIAGSGEPWTYNSGNLQLQWDLSKDKAKLISTASNAGIWQGSLLPSFWVLVNQQKQFVKASVVAAQSVVKPEALHLNLRIGHLGTGVLDITSEPWGVSFNHLEISWTGKAPAILEMYFGASSVSEDSSAVSPTWDRPFMGDWQSFGYCIPGAKGGTVQSYFRMWDFGQASIALGSFGPSLGSPYGAAYPRPLYYAAMGSDAGYMVAGAGSVPDAVMMLRVQSTSSCLQYIYREDLWGGPAGSKRTWKQPLRLTMGGNAYAAMERYYQSFPGRTNTSHPATAIWNTWGMWRDKNYVIRPLADFARSISSEILVLDDPWESKQGSGTPNLQKFPDFFEDLQYIRSQGMEVGVWETIAWISDPYSSGLTLKDLLLKKDGKPCRANWNFSPWSGGYYCMDISSQKVQQFIRERTTQIMKTVHPALIKLDFGYGCPDPSVTAPRDPAYRGERYSYELVKLISEAAKAVDPNVTIMYYSLSPLWAPVTDLVSMDDQGDLWYDIKKGHQEWSIWASLLSSKNIAVNGSSSYDWSQDDEVLMNTCIIGSPGGVLPSVVNQQPANPAYINRRLAVHEWFRRTTTWHPLWLNSFTGSLNAPPALHCWGRQEMSGKDSILTSLVLRDTVNQSLLNDSYVTHLRWTGQWALIAQDTAAISQSKKLAVIPFSEGEMAIPYDTKPSVVKKLSTGGVTSDEQWQWQNGKVFIRMTKEMLDHTAGFLIER